jgi:hypothetical protein
MNFTPKWRPSRQATRQRTTVPLARKLDLDLILDLVRGKAGLGL